MTVISIEDFRKEKRRNGSLLAVPEKVSEGILAGEVRDEYLRITRQVYEDLVHVNVNFALHFDGLSDEHIALNRAELQRVVNQCEQRAGELFLQFSYVLLRNFASKGK